MEKAKITKSQAKALEHWLKTYAGGKEELIKTHSENGTWTGESEALNGLSLERLLVALHIGYEISKREIAGECAGCQKDVLSGDTYLELNLNGESYLLHQDPECTYDFVAEMSICHISE